MSVDIKIETVYRPYKQKLIVWDQVLSGNNFLKVTVFNQDFYISTLPKIHELSLKELEFGIRTFFESSKLSFDNIDLNLPFFNTVSNKDLYHVEAQLLFNIESILLSYIHQNISPLSLKEIHSNDIFTNDKNINDYKNCDSLKIKIRPIDDHKKINDLLKKLIEINPYIRFRLDGNRCFSLLELLHLDKALDSQVKLHIEYIEEPFLNFYDNVLFRMKSSLRLAIDENFTHLIHSSEIKNFFIVIKPSLFGISKINLFLTQNPQAQVTISSTYEHESMLLGHYFLASKTLNKYHGLSSFVL